MPHRKFSKLPSFPTAKIIVLRCEHFANAKCLRVHLISLQPYGCPDCRTYYSQTGENDGFQFIPLHLTTHNNQPKCVSCPEIISPLHEVAFSHKCGHLYHAPCIIGHDHCPVQNCEFLFTWQIRTVPPFLKRCRSSVSILNLFGIDITSVPITIIQPTGGTGNHSSLPIERPILNIHLKDLERKWRILPAAVLQGSSTSTSALEVIVSSVAKHKVTISKLQQELVQSQNQVKSLEETIIQQNKLFADLMKYDQLQRQVLLPSWNPTLPRASLFLPGPLPRPLGFCDSPIVSPNPLPTADVFQEVDQEELSPVSRPSSNKSAQAVVFVSKYKDFSNKPIPTTNTELNFGGSEQLSSNSTAPDPHASAERLFVHPVSAAESTHAIFGSLSSTTEEPSSTPGAGTSKAHNRPRAEPILGIHSTVGWTSRNVQATVSESILASSTVEGTLRTPNDSFDRTTLFKNHHCIIPRLSHSPQRSAKATGALSISKWDVPFNYPLGCNFCPTYINSGVTPQTACSCGATPTNIHNTEIDQTLQGSLAATETPPRVDGQIIVEVSPYHLPYSCLIETTI